MRRRGNIVLFEIVVNVKILFQKKVKNSIMNIRKK